MELLIAILIIFVVCSFFLLRKILEKQDEEIKKEKKVLNSLIKDASETEGKVKKRSLFRSKSEIVRESSQKVKDLIDINSSTHFYKIQPKFKIEKFYDNKTHFLKIDPAALLAAEMRNDIDKFAQLIKQIRENREEFKKYQERINELFQKEYPIDFEALKISTEDYYKFERKILNELMLKPITSSSYMVEMRYSSPGGRVNLCKSDVFNFDDMLACYESISRSYLDKETYKKLAKVERGEVSDSLRYDIMNRDNFTCVLCGTSARQGARLHVDHIIPIAKGGKSTIDNLRTLCERCNVGKSDKIEGNFSTENAGSNKPTCQWCGADMILRHGKNGEFYGCSNYPRCKYTKGKYE